MRTLAEKLSIALERQGYKVDAIRQPVPSLKQPGFVEFHDPAMPDWRSIIKVFSRLKKYDSQLVDMIAAAERRRNRDVRAAEKADSLERAGNGGDSAIGPGGVDARKPPRRKRRKG